MLIPAIVARGTPASLRGSVVVFPCSPGTIGNGRCHLWNGLPEFSGGMMGSRCGRGQRKERLRWVWLAWQEAEMKSSMTREVVSGNWLVWPSKALICTSEQILNEQRRDLSHVAGLLCLLVTSSNRASSQTRASWLKGRVSSCKEGPCYSSKNVHGRCFFSLFPKGLCLGERQVPWLFEDDCSRSKAGPGTGLS